MSSSKRPVDILRTEWVSDADGFKKTKIGEGTFHEWGVAQKKFKVGAVGITVAIVEHADGTITFMDPDCIQFTDGGWDK